MRYDDIKPEKDELYGKYAALALSVIPIRYIKDDFVAAYLDPHEPLCYIELAKPNDQITTKDTFFSDYELGNTYLYVFKIKEADQPDYHHFINGKWSELSDKFCKRLEKLAELPRFQKLVNRNGDYLQHLIFSIIYKNDTYREKLELALNEKIPEDVELYGTPKLENFKTLTEFFEEEQ
jgi:hypothetical protein